MGYGTDAQKQLFLPLIAEGQLMGFGLTEVKVGVNAKKVRAYVEPDQEGQKPHQEEKAGKREGESDRGHRLAGTVLLDNRWELDREGREDEDLRVVEAREGTNLRRPELEIS